MDGPTRKVKTRGRVRKISGQEDVEQQQINTSQQQMVQQQEENQLGQGGKKKTARKRKNSGSGSENGDQKNQEEATIKGAAIVVSKNEKKFEDQTEERTLKKKRPGAKRKKSNEEEEVTAKPVFTEELTKKKKPVGKKQRKKSGEEDETNQEQYKNPVTLSKKSAIPTNISEEEQAKLAAMMNGLTKTVKNAPKLDEIAVIDSYTKFMPFIESDEPPPALIFYKNKRILHGNILKKEEYYNQFNGNLKLIIKRATAKQNIIFTRNKTPSGLGTDAELIKFLKSYSKIYHSIIGTRELARGGEAVVYRIEHAGLDEIVAKCPLIDENATTSEIIEAYQGIFYESQTLKLNSKRELMAEIKEEIIEYNKELGLITRYCVIVECASNTMNGLIKIWNNEKESQKKREFFSPEKLTFYCYQAMSAVEYCHQKHLFYSDMKGANLLVFRNQEVKLGDLGISVKMDAADDDPTDEKYFGKGVTPGYVTSVYMSNVENGLYCSRNQFFNCDKFAMEITFKYACDDVEALLHEKFNEVQEDQYYYQMYMDFKDKKSKLPDILAKWSRILANDASFCSKFANQLIFENKEIALSSIFQVSKYRPIIQSYLDIIRFETNDELQKQRFSNIEEDDDSDWPQHERDKIEQIQIKGWDEIYVDKLDMDEYPPSLKEIIIKFLTGWQWGEPISDKYRKVFKNSVQNGFFIYDDYSGGVISELDFNQIVETYASKWFQNDISQKFEIIQKQKAKTKTLIKFLEAFINDPKEIDKERACYELQKLYLGAQLFQINDLSNYLLFRIGKIMTQNSQGRISTLKALNEYKKEKNDKMIAECLTVLISQCKEGEVEYARKYYQQAKVIIKLLYGRNSKNYAELCQARTRFLSAIGKYKIAWRTEHEALNIYSSLMGSAHPKTLEAHLRVSKFIYAHYRSKDFQNFRREDAQMYLQYGLKHAKGQKDLWLKAALFQLAMNYYDCNIKTIDKDINSLWYTQGLIKEHQLDYFMKGYDQPYLMGPTNYIYNDPDKIQFLRSLEKGFDEITLKYLNTKIADDGETLRVDYVSKDMKSAERFINTFEFREHVMKTVNNQHIGVYCSHPYGSVSDKNISWFDDFDHLMPYMMNPLNENRFDKNRVVKLVEIRYLELNRAIIGWKAIYKYDDQRFYPITNENIEGKKREKKVYDSDDENESDDEEIKLDWEMKDNESTIYETKWISNEAERFLDESEEMLKQHFKLPEQIFLQNKIRQEKDQEIEQRYLQQKEKDELKFKEDQERINQQIEEEQNNEKKQLLKNEKQDMEKRFKKDQERKKQEKINLIAKKRNEEEIEDSQIQKRRIIFDQNEHIVDVEVQWNEHLGIKFQTAYITLEEDGVTVKVAKDEDGKIQINRTLYLGDFNENYKDDYAQSEADTKIIAFGGGFMQYEDPKFKKQALLSGKQEQEDIETKSSSVGIQENEKAQQQQQKDEKSGKNEDEQKKEVEEEEEDEDNFEQKQKDVGRIELQYLFFYMVGIEHK